MKPYHQLTREQRYQIAALREVGRNQSEIARVLGVHKSTVSRELRRNHATRGYRPRHAPPPRLGPSRGQGALCVDVPALGRDTSIVAAGLGPGTNRWTGRRRRGVSGQPRMDLPEPASGQTPGRRSAPTSALPEGPAQALRQGPPRAWCHHRPDRDRRAPRRGGTARASR